MRHNQAIQATLPATPNTSGPFTGLLHDLTCVYQHLTPSAVQWLMRDLAFHAYQSDSFRALPFSDRKRLHDAMSIFSENMREIGEHFESEHPEFVTEESNY